MEDSGVVAYTGLTHPCRRYVVSDPRSSHARLNYSPKITHAPDSEHRSFFLDQVHPDCGVSSKSMSILNSLMTDMFDKIATEAAKLCRISKVMFLSG